MRKFVPLAFSILFLAASSFAQVPTPDPGDVVKISTSLIQVDVTVTDKNGEPITDLRPDEMEIYENGKRKKITNFSFVSGTRPQQRPSESGKSSVASQPLLPGPPVRLESVRRSVAIVVDDLQMSFASSFWVTDALRKFIKNDMQEGDLVSIIRTSGGSGILQQFTTDRRQLLAAIERPVRGGGGISFFTPIRDVVGGSVNPKTREIEALRDSVFGAGTLGALNFVIRGMKDLPGRKSIVLLSDRVKLLDRDSAGRPSFSLNYYAIRRLIDAANRSSISLYPIHSPGLIVPMMSAEDDVTDISLAGNHDKTGGILTDRIRDLGDSQEGLKFLAENTGGFAVINSNSITKGLRRIMGDQSYYLVAYDPDEDTFERGRGPFDPKSLKFNKHDVKVSRPGARVRFRSGFSGVSDEQNVQSNSSPTQQIISAIFSPFTSSQIDVRMNVLFMADPQRKPTVVSYVNVDPAGLTFTDAGNGMRKTSFDLIAFTFGSEGKVIDERSKNFTVTVTQPQYETLTKRGLIAKFDLPVKNSGGYQVRLAVRDTASTRMGTATQFIQIPQVERGRFALSGAILSSSTSSGTSASDGVSLDAEDPVRYTSVRQFNLGSALQFSLVAYNPKLGSLNKPVLSQSYRLYRDNKVVFTSAERQVSIDGPSATKVVPIAGGLVLGADLIAGDYLIEVIVEDQNDKGRIATQYIPFEIVN